MPCGAVMTAEHKRYRDNLRDERLHQLLVLGATAVLRRAKPGKATAWLIAFFLDFNPCTQAAVDTQPAVY